jgi:hypothetical protein
MRESCRMDTSGRKISPIFRLGSMRGVDSDGSCHRGSSRSGCNNNSNKDSKTSSRRIRRRTSIDSSVADSTAAEDTASSSDFGEDSSDGESVNLGSGQDGSASGGRATASGICPSELACSLERRQSERLQAEMFVVEQRLSEDWEALAADRRAAINRLAERRLSRAQRSRRVSPVTTTVQALAEQPPQQVIDRSHVCRADTTWEAKEASQKHAAVQEDCVAEVVGKAAETAPTTLENADTTVEKEKAGAVSGSSTVVGLKVEGNGSTCMQNLVFNGVNVLVYSKENIEYALRNWSQQKQQQ